jgi:hydroxysqualene dehydroxylase
MTRNGHVAVVGGGWSGLAAAVALVDSGHIVTLFEASAALGGRARSLSWKVADGHVVTLDNGQHILIGAYQHTLELMRHVGVREHEVLHRMPLTMASASGLHLQAWRLPAPLHLLFAILCARGLSLRSRLSMAHLVQTASRSGFRVDPDVTVDAYLGAMRQPEQLCARMWRPLCVAALNTPSALASAQVFLNVLRDSIGARRAASDLLLPTTGLSEVLPDACGRFVAARGHIRLGALVTRMANAGEVVQVTERSGAIHEFDGVVLATPAHQWPHIDADPSLALAKAASHFAWQPITTVYLLYQTSRRLPEPMLALSEDVSQGRFVQWLFDKGALGGEPGLFAAVISAGGPHEMLEHGELAASVIEQLRTELGWQDQPVALRVISEKRATFSCTPDLYRSATATAWPRLMLAGDAIASDYPATLETAVRNGQAAAAALARELQG